MLSEKTVKEVNKELSKNDLMFRFKLRLNVDEFGKYKKGDEDIFYAKLIDKQNGLLRFPIDKKWDILSCKVVMEINANTKSI
jgi:hypothetical protein